MKLTIPAGTWQCCASARLASSTNTDAPESKKTTAIYFDETPVSYNGLNPDLQLVDIERIEVLKKPQGTLEAASPIAA